VLAVYVQFKARVWAQLLQYKDPHSPRRAPVRFTQAIPEDFKDKFPVMYVVDRKITNDASLFGAHSVVLPGKAAELESLMKKRKRGEDSDDDIAF
jgi:hypothetical protein